MAGSMAEALAKNGLISKEDAKRIETRKSAVFAGQERKSLKTGKMDRNGIPVIVHGDDNFFPCKEEK